MQVEVGVRCPPQGDLDVAGARVGLADAVGADGPLDQPGRAEVDERDLLEGRIGGLDLDGRGRVEALPGVVRVLGHVVHVEGVALAGVAQRGDGSASGLPQLHLTRGTPVLSTSTAVPACSSDWNGVASPLLNPWLVTRVS